MILVTRAHDQHLSRLEDRLDSIFTILNDDNTKDAYDLVGESMATLRLVKKRIKTKEERLMERGLRSISEIDVFQGGESVVIMDGGPLEGETAIVCHQQEKANDDEVMVEMESEFGASFDQEFLDPNSLSVGGLKMKRGDLAVWYYPDVDDDWGNSFDTFSQAKSIPDSRNKLFDTLNSLKPVEQKKKSAVPSSKLTNGVKEKKFMSSRERKALSKASKKQKKKKR